MEILETPQESQDSIVVNDAIKECLIETAKWAKVIAIIGFVGIGIMALVGFSFLAFQRGLFIQNQLIISIVYIIISIVYFFPIRKLFQFARATNEGILYENQELFTYGIRNLKSHYKFIGICTLIIIGIYLLIFLFAIFSFL